MHEDFHKPQAFFDQVHDGIVLPLEICDHLLQTMVAEGLDIDDRVAKAFRYIFSSKKSVKNWNLRQLFEFSTISMRKYGIP